MQSTQKTLAELEIMTEAELEIVIDSKSASSDDARYTLGKLQIEGSFPERVPRNEQKGLHWIKHAVENEHLPAIEYKAYFDIRFSKDPHLEKIVAMLTKSVKGTDSCRAACTLAEIAHGQKDQDLAAKQYAIAADQGDIVGSHWLGVYYLEGFGVAQNLDKGEALLIKAAKAGNGQSHFQLFILYSSFDPKKNAAKAYKHIIKSIQLGVTHWEQAEKYFKDNYAAVSSVFIALKCLDASTLQQKQVENLHEAWLSEMKDTFSDRLGKDRLYERPCGCITDQQIWMVGVLMKYFLNEVMHFEQEDFLTALSVDLGPLMGETGLWFIHNYEVRMQDKGKTEKRKKAKVAQELISEYMANGLEKLGKLTMYNMKNKYCPKKLPNEKRTRSDIKFIYSWNHYAPLNWFQSKRKMEDKTKDALNNKGEPTKIQLCSWCQSPESPSMPHKRCAQCKQRMYCTVDCQRFDWKKSHKAECKDLAAKAKK